MPEVMRVCAVTPHLPPEQAANALLPRQLGDALVSAGVSTTYVAHPPATGRPAHEPPGVTYVARRGKGMLARSRVGAVMAGAGMARGALAPIRACDVVHLHGNGFIIEAAQAVAARCGKPCVITLYGTDVWHHDPARHGRFARVVRSARERVFYSRGLMAFAEPLGLAVPPSRVIYAPVPAAFRPMTAEARAQARTDLGAGPGPILLTVKRLHDVAGHDVLLRALAQVFARHRDGQAWFVGDGELRPGLEALAAEQGIADRVRFLGLLSNDELWRLYGAADLFVLPSRLESWGTVMLEALACGTRVVATDTAGGLEVHEHFPDDVRLVPREDAAALSVAILEGLATCDRAGAQTAERLRSEFSVAGCAARYLDVYRSALHAA